MKQKSGKKKKKTINMQQKHHMDNWSRKANLHQKGRNKKLRMISDFSVTLNSRNIKTTTQFWAKENKNYKLSKIKRLMGRHSQVGRIQAISLPFKNKQNQNG